jgi:hypothetical protein
MKTKVEIKKQKPVADPSYHWSYIKRYPGVYECEQEKAVIITIVAGNPMFVKEDNRVEKPLPYWMDRTYKKVDYSVTLTVRN